jgi:hypothetical protein
LSALNYIEILLCFFLLSFLIWKEINRPDKRRLIARIAASAIAVVSLACITLPIYVNEKITTQNKEAIILTEGFDNDSVQLFSKSNNNLRTFSTDDYLYEKPIDINKVHIFGYGFSKDELNQLPENSYSFHPTDILTGVHSVSWKHQLNASEKLQVQGNFYNATDHKIKLVLSLFNIPLDSSFIIPKMQAEFNLQNIPKFFGRAVYQLLAISGRDTLEQEEVPVEVISAPPLKILMLSSSPDFENKFLINWLSQNKNQVAIRTTISKNKYDVTYLGLPHFSLRQITPSLLDNFDLIIGDASELQSMNSSELFFIQNAVENKSLGLIVRADTITKKNIFFNRFFPMNFLRNDSSGMINLRFGSDTSVVSINSGQLVSIYYKPGVQPLATDAHSRIVAATTVFGLGKLVYTTLPDTYSWALAGKKNNYDRFWQLILQNAAKKNTAVFNWNINPELPKINEHAEIYLQTNDTAIPSAQIENIHLSFIQNPLLPFQWNASYWPADAGWQRCITKNDTAWFYAFKKNDWKNADALQRIEQTKKFVLSSQNPDKVNNPEQLFVRKLISKIFFYIFFLAGCLFLWIERKL